MGTRQFLQMLGPKRVMGVAIGNEMELYYQKKNINKSCVVGAHPDLWSKSNTSYHKKMQLIAADLDEDGMSDTKLTAVFGGAIKSGSPFEVHVTKFFKDSHE